MPLHGVCSCSQKDSCMLLEQTPTTAILRQNNIFPQWLEVVIPLFKKQISDNKQSPFLELPWTKKHIYSRAHHRSLFNPVRVAKTFFIVSRRILLRPITFDPFRIRNLKVIKILISVSLRGIYVKWELILWRSVEVWRTSKSFDSVYSGNIYVKWELIFW